MLILERDNMVGYLRVTGLVAPGCAVEVVPLAWGVSNAVFRVNTPSGDFVVKQSREQLRTQAAWFSRLDRVWREVAALRVAGEIWPDGVVPRVLFEDRENYVFAMTAAPAVHRVWKGELLAGTVDPGIAGAVGDYLAALHAQTAGRADLRSAFSDRTVFTELRIDPFYRYVAQAHSEMMPEFDGLIDEALSGDVCLVHADYSPKNVLVHAEGLTLVDLETAHWGDPAFDLGFLNSHLLLKAIRHRERLDEYAGLTRAFWSRYLPGLEQADASRDWAGAGLIERSTRHLAGCMWARVDGKSPVDYLPEENLRETVRTYCRGLFRERLKGWDDVLQWLRECLGRSGGLG